jgi:predicted lipoprotein with Yx(FWY)xxD motif
MSTPIGRAAARRVIAGLALCAGAGGAALVAAPAASAHSVAPAAHASAPRPTAAVVVKKATRGKFGTILVTTKGLALYEHPGGPCTGSCLQVWPPLLMPKGTTQPEGATGLGTAPYAGGRLQVTYHKQRLYTFVSDSGTSVKGNGVGGFVVAKVS